MEKIIQLPFDLPPLSGLQMADLVEGLNTHLPGESDAAIVFAYGQDPNPRKVKRTINIFLLLWTLSQRRPQLRNFIKPIRLAKIVVLQHSYRDLFNIILWLPTRLGELEAYFRRQENPVTDAQESLPENLKPFLQVRELRSLLTLHAQDMEDANFALWQDDKFNPLPEAEIKAYIELTRSIASNQTNLTGADLRNAQLAGADLSGQSLARARLTGANLTGARLANTDLSYTDLQAARLIYADLIDANLTNANLREADLSSSDLGGAILLGANLERTNIQGANFRGANIEGANLREALGLTQEQIELAISNEETQLPSDLRATSEAKASIIDDPETWVDRGNELLSLRRYPEALEAYEQALRLRPEYPEALRGKGYSLSASGFISAAKDVFRYALEIQEKVLGPEHPATAESAQDLANLLAQQGEYAAARSLYERALAIRESTLGRDHPDTAESMAGLANLLFQQGELTEARSLYERALAIQEKVLGPDHPDTAESMAGLANLLAIQGDSKGAESLYERALRILQRGMGRDYPGTVRIQEVLAELRNKGKES